MQVKDLGVGTTVGRKPATKVLEDRADEAEGRPIRARDIARSASRVLGAHAAHGANNLGLSNIHAAERYGNTASIANDTIT